jgi:hypothetical protein
MLTGYTAPRTPGGASSLVPAPPWHYVGDFLMIEFWADPEASTALLPEGLTPHEDAGRMAAMFVDWQSCSDDRSELLDPSRSQYREFVVTISARYGDREVAYCPHIWVDRDFSLYRGWIQGFPKKMGSVGITRTFTVDAIASPGLKPGATFGASASAHERRLAAATVTLENTTESMSRHFALPTVNVRHFPRLQAGRHNDPAVHELVGVLSYDRTTSTIWTGSAALDFFENPGEELTDLSPVKVGRGFRFSYAYSTDDLKHLQQLGTPTITTTRGSDR